MSRYAIRTQGGKVTRWLQRSLPHRIVWTADINADLRTYADVDEAAATAAMLQSTGMACVVDLNPQRRSNARTTAA